MKYLNFLTIEFIFFSLIVVGIVSVIFYNLNFKIPHSNDFLILLIQIISIVFALTGLGYFYIFKKIDDYKIKYLKEFQETIYPAINSHKNLLSSYLKIIDEIEC